MWDKDRRHGKGKYTYPGGDVFDGEWENGEIGKKGLFLGKDNFRYEGNWEGGLMHGLGKITWPNGDTYEGSLEKGFL